MTPEQSVDTRTGLSSEITSIWLVPERRTEMGVEPARLEVTYNSDWIEYHQCWHYGVPFERASFENSTWTKSYMGNKEEVARHLANALVEAGLKEKP